MLINSIDGSYKESHQIKPLIYQQRQAYCTLSDDESALFCLGIGRLGVHAATVIRFDTKYKEFHYFYNTDENYDRENLGLAVLNRNEISFLFYDYDKSYYWIKGSFDFTQNSFKEAHRLKMSNKEGKQSAKICLDEKGATIWYVAEVNDTNIMYQQNNVSDFALIGNKYVFTNTISYEASGINSISIMGGTLYILFDSSLMHLFATVDTSTQKVAKVYKTSSFYQNNTKDLFAMNGYINIFNYRSSFLKKVSHNQVKSGSNTDFLPRYSEVKNVTFYKIIDSSFDFEGEELQNRTIYNTTSDEYLLNYTDIKDQLYVLEANSYIISLPESFEQEFLVGSNQTITKDIDLSCSIAYSSLNYTILDNERSKKPDWVTIDYSSFEIHMRTPDVNKTTKFSFVVSTQYLDGSLNSTINIVVTPCTSIEHCQE